MIRREAVMCRFCRTAPSIEQPNSAELKTTLESQFGVNYLSLETTAVWPECLQLLSEEDIRTYEAVPVRRVREKLMVAMVTPNDENTLHAINEILGEAIQPTVCTPESYRWFMANRYNLLISEADDEAQWLSRRKEEAAQAALKAIVSETEDAAPRAGTRAGSEYEDDGDDDGITSVRPKQGVAVTQEGPIVVLASLILSDGIKCGAAEISIEPSHDKVNVYNVVRGETKLARTLPNGIGAFLVARFKEMAGISGAARSGLHGVAETTVGGQVFMVSVQATNSRFGEKLLLQPRRRAG